MPEGAWILPATIGWRASGFTGLLITAEREIIRALQCRGRGMGGGGAWLWPEAELTIIALSVSVGEQ
jgi:hypothetical protein